MREIKFRGKRIDNGEWVCGYIVKVASPCGCKWNISIKKTIPGSGYICPRCANKDRQDRAPRRGGDKWRRQI